MRLRAALLAAPCITVATVVASPARAQAPPPPSQQPAATDSRALAETLFFTARGLMEAGRYAEACGKLNESYRLDAAAGTLLNLAVCNEKIGKIASAWGEFRDAAAEARRMNRPDREQLATERVKVIEPELPFLAVSVPPMLRTVRGLEITRNGIPLTSAAWDTELPVDPGDVEVVERAPGYKPHTLHVTMAAKQHATVTALPLELAPIDCPPPPFWTAKRTTGFALMAGGVVAAGLGAYFGVQATKQKSDSDGQCPDYFGDLRCTQTGVDDMNRAKTSAWASDIAFGVAVVGVGLGSFLFFTGGHGQEQAQGPTPRETWSWRVGGTPRGAAGWLTRSF